MVDSRLRHRGGALSPAWNRALRNRVPRPRTTRASKLLRGQPHHTLALAHAHAPHAVCKFAGGGSRLHQSQPRFQVGQIPQHDRMRLPLGNLTEQTISFGQVPGVGQKERQLMSCQVILVMSQQGGLLKSDRPTQRLLVSPRLRLAKLTFYFSKSVQGHRTDRFTRYGVRCEAQSTSMLISASSCAPRGAKS